MTTKLINYFKIKAKYDKQNHNYYIDNLKTIFEHYYYYNDDNEFVDNPRGDFYINLSISDYKSKYESRTWKVDLESKRRLNEGTFNDIINIYNLICDGSFYCTNIYTIKLQNYILYILEKQRTKQTHEENKYKQYKKYKQWFDIYDMVYPISYQITHQRLVNIERNIEYSIDRKINDNLADILNDNPDMLKNLIYNISDKSKEILINEIIKYNEGEVIERVSKLIAKNKTYNKIANKVVKQSEEQVKIIFNDYLKSNSVKESIDKEVTDFLTYNSYLIKRCDTHIHQNINNLYVRLNNISKTIKELKLQYTAQSASSASANNDSENNNNSDNNNSNNNNSNNNNSSSDSDNEISINDNIVPGINNELIDEINNELINDDSNDENVNNNYDECFLKHGNKYKLRFKELIKFSKFSSVKLFKEALIKNNIIKNDFTLSNNTYILTEEQKKQFIIDFNKFNK